MMGRSRAGIECTPAVSSSKSRVRDHLQLFSVSLPKTMFERNRRLSLPLSVPNSNGPKHDPDGPDDEKRRPKRTGWLTVHVPLPPGLPEAWRTSTRSTVSSSSSASKRRWQRAFVIPLPLPAAWRSRRGARILRACLVLGLLLLVVHYWTGSGVRTARTKGSSVVLAPDEIAKVWQWELFSGHHPGVTRGEYIQPNSADFQCHPKSCSAERHSTPSCRPASSHWTWTRRPSSWVAGRCGGPSPRAWTRTRVLIVRAHSGRARGALLIWTRCTPCARA
jgi:hypothetical protein